MTDPKASHSASTMAAPPRHRGDEPSMFLQRPSSARSQSVAHILTRTFRQYFTREALAPETVQHLAASQGGDDSYHQHYVDALKQVQEERESRMAQADMLERHLMQSLARAMSADERELNRTTSGNTSFPDLGLPPARSFYRSCVDTELLKSHNLITPDDFISEHAPTVPPPPGQEAPSYTRDTLSSSRRMREEGGVLATDSPFPSRPGSVDLDDLPSRTGSSFSMDEPLPPITNTGVVGALPHAWKEQISAEDREYNRLELANLQAKVDFLKNPRHLAPSAGPNRNKSLIKAQKKRHKEIGIKPKADIHRSQEPSVVFLASPSVIKFTEYSVGQVYEMTLELKNVTSVLRPVRIVPPKTQYFSVGLGQFPGEHGLVAAGMSCRYMIRFAPDSLADYDDTLTMQTQSSTPLVVRLEGRRQPPVLSVPRTVDVGQCLTGGVKIGQFHMRNEGGSGRFCLLPRSAWPASNFKNALSAGKLVMSPFEVRPSIFELKKGENLTMEVMFAPTEVSEYEEEMVIVCNNCHVQYLAITGQGQTAHVQLTSVEGGVSDPSPGELCDVSAQHLIKFDNLNPYTYLQKGVLVRNMTGVELSYDWVTVKPYITPSIPVGDEEPKVPMERVQAVDSVFSISPESGSLQPHATTTFTLTFAPPLVANYHDALHLVLRNIPRISLSRHPSKATPDTELKRSDSLPVSGSPEANFTGPQATEIHVEDVTSLELEVKGVCEPLSVLLQPYAITVPGQTMVETLIKRSFKMYNNSLSAALFQWENHSGDFILEVEPPIGELAPQCDLDLEVSIAASKPCKIQHMLTCFVHHLEEPLYLHIEADVKGPELTIEECDLNFGLIRIGEESTRSLTLTNPCRVPAKWSIQPPDSLTEGEDGKVESEFCFSPSCGELRPLESGTVTVTFRPQRCQSVRAVVEVCVEEGTPRCIVAFGEVQQPQVCLLSCQLSLDDTFIGVPVCHQVSLLNQTLLPTTFEWGELSGRDAKDCSVSVEPSGGVLQSRQQLDLTLTFTPHRLGALEDLLLPVTVRGMSAPLLLRLSAHAAGLSVSYSCPDSESGLALDFGSAVSLGEKVERRFVVRNNSAIPAAFSFSMEHFPGRQMSESAGPEPKSTSNSQRKGLLSKTANLSDPKSQTPTKAQAAYEQAVLSDGSGAAFLLSPASGSLPPYGDLDVSVTALSDMWGDYSDRIVCQVADLEAVLIPVKMSVVGSPLYFQMTAASKKSAPIVRFGTLVSGVKPVMRQMRINNPSPYDVRIDWQTFNKETESKQLLDFIVSFGESFPLLDDNGREVEPREEAPPPAKRPPTNLLPDSPASTPALSRQLTESEVPTPTTVPQERPKIVSVTTRLHEGRRDNRPYSITPQQLVIPARGSGCINVSFTPMESADVSHEVECVGFALGYLSLAKGAACDDNKVQRLTGYDMTPLRLEMTGRVKPALLTVECDDDDGLNYQSTASDLLENGQVLPECLKLSRAMLTNNTMTTLTFRLVTMEPFYIVRLDGATRKPLAHLLQTDMTSLRSHENALVQVGFRLNPDLLSFAEKCDGSEESITHEQGERERRIHFKHSLQIEFNNNSSQRIPLHATLILPSLTLSRETLDFGTCLVGQRRELQLLLFNWTSSGSVWTIVQESRSSNSTDETFQVAPSGGMLDPYMTHVSDSKVLVKFYFTAKHCERYAAVYVVRGMLGEEERRLKIRGEGSYDGKHEALVDV